MAELSRIPRHPTCTEVEKVLAEMRELGWLSRPGGHWEVAFCPEGCCHVSVSGTPKNCGNTARRLRREYRRCPGTGPA
jgi:hypothetical protein